MNDIEKKALALVNEACKSDFKDLGITYRNNILDALLLAIEQHEAFRQEVSDAMKLLSEKHEAFRQEVSDAVGWWNMEYLLGDDLRKDMARFIIPKPDPLVEVLWDAGFAHNKDTADQLRAALDARGLEIREKQS